ncbi:type II toxin-antitoxin system VapC family toxin [Aureimonas sp. SK2]|uniref:type II toxin-antitoxin system VapC family toxin n=1 Tax=Aureimonas sp. SK2 TaxID=3015992 RepID=UPI00244431F7|nr:type II toxin-antitoxin system VapC family toxin [Aureimonas sp. SK2]
MLFIDASVIVAILLREDDAEALYDRLIDNGGPYRVSPIVRIEASLSIARAMAANQKPSAPATRQTIERAQMAVDAFIEAIGATDVSITSSIGTKAIESAGRFGKIVGHPARLNMGDCLAYACAKGYRAGLAFKGDDFPHTDLGWDGITSSHPRPKGAH